MPTPGAAATLARQARHDALQEAASQLWESSCELVSGIIIVSYCNVSRAQRSTEWCADRKSSVFLAVPDQQCTAQMRAALRPGHESGNCESEY